MAAVCLERPRTFGVIILYHLQLNTHAESSLRKTFGEEKAEAFFARVTSNFTPSPASWLNMAELEINCLKKQGLGCRIATEEKMKNIALAIVAERNAQKAKINWGFTKTKAQEKFPALYGMN